jgi:hypothetical protein
MKSNYPVIISITTLPSRIGKMRPCLESLLSGQVVPDKLLLALPAVSKRENSPYCIPDFLRDADFCGSRINIVNADRDWGPGTKLLGSLDALPIECYLVLADDDVRYRPDFLAGLLNAQVRDHRSSFSYYTYRVEGLTIGQGCDGFTFWSPNVFGMKSFAESHVDGTDLFFHDDLWISFFLALKGIAIKSLRPQLGGTLIYETLHETNSLRYLTGSLAREDLSRREARKLFQKIRLPLQTKLKIDFMSAYDKLISLQVARLKRFMSRAKAI